MLDQHKLGLTDSLELDKDGRKNAKRAKELFEKQLLDDKAAGTYATLAVIHSFLLKKFMTSPAKIRTVNLAKRNVRFAPVM